MSMSNILQYLRNPNYVMFFYMEFIGFVILVSFYEGQIWAEAVSKRQNQIFVIMSR